MGNLFKKYLPLMLTLFITASCVESFSYKIQNGSIVKIPSSWLTQFGAVTKSFLGANHSQNDSCFAVAADASGNVYCAGSTSGSIGEPNGGGTDAFVTKFNSSGKIVWSRQLGSATQAASAFVNNTAGNDQCSGVAVDAAGNVYCAGTTSGSLGEATGGSNDAFILKLNSSGEVVWLRQLGSVTEAASAQVNDASGYDSCSSITVDGAGNIYCAGSSGSLGEANSGLADALILKLDSSGSVTWVKQLGLATMGVNAAQNDVCNSVAVDNAGNVYCAGNTEGPLGEANGGNRDAFVLKLDLSGNITWLNHIGGATEAVSPFVNSTAALDSCEGVAVDSTGNVYCGGYTRGSLAEASGGGGDVFIMKLDSLGAITWIKQLGSVTVAASAQINDVSNEDSCHGIALDNQGNIYCYGETTSVLSEARGNWGWDPMIIKFDPTGTVEWIKQLGSVTIPHADYDGGLALGGTVDSQGNAYICGEIYGHATEDEGGGGNSDVFVAKIKSDGTLEL